MMERLKGVVMGLFLTVSAFILGLAYFSVFNVSVDVGGSDGAQSMPYFDVPPGWVDDPLEVNITQACGTESDIKSMAWCVHAYVSEIFNYTTQEDSRVMSFQELVDEGGDCKNWAELWLRLMASMNVSGEYMRIPVDDDSAHAFAVVHGSDGYCVADQRHLDCFMYG